METVVQIAAVCLAAAILGAVLRQHSPETAAVLGLAVCAVVGVLLLRGLAEVLDMLEELKRKGDGYDVDVLVVYGDDCDLEELAGLCAGLRNQGESVTALKNIPERFRYRRLLRADGGKSHG